jgi:preprotein translocase subunit SecD
MEGGQGVRFYSLAAALLFVATGLAGAKPEDHKPGKDKSAATVTPAPAKPRPKLDPQKDFITEFKFSLDRGKASATKLNEADLKAIAATLEKRLPILSVEPGEVEVVSIDDIRVRVPYSRLPAGALRQFTRPGQFAVRRLEDIHTSLNPGGDFVIESRNINGVFEMRFLNRRTSKRIPAQEYIENCPVLVATEDIEADSARRVGEGVQMSVRVLLNEEGTKRFRSFQKKPGRMAAMVLDGQVLSINAVTQKYREPKRKRGEPREETLDELDISAGFGNADEAGFLANVLNSGALPYPLKLVSQGLMGGKQLPPDEEEDDSNPLLDGT